MARKKKHEEHVNLERWLVSYADFITLLFAFFVVMYSVSAVNAGKFRVMSNALTEAFNPTISMSASKLMMSPEAVGRVSTKNPVLIDLGLFEKIRQEVKAEVDYPAGGRAGRDHCRRTFRARQWRKPSPD